MVSIRSITNEETQERFRYLDPASNHGPFARVLSVALDDIMRCKAADLFGWCHQVGEPALEQPVGVDIHHKVEDTSNYFRTDGKKAVFTDILMLSGSGSGARHACH